MISYMPEIYPDELIFSWFCRYYVHSGCTTHKMALDDIFYKKCNNPSKEFLGHLQADMLLLMQKMYSLEGLVLNHTMFPQYARFIPLEQKKRALQHMAYDFCDAHHLFAILPRNEIDSALKYCPICAKEDIEQFGETYWHRVHQIRNMQVCNKHGCYLHRSAVPAKSEQSFALFPAQSYMYNKEIQSVKNTVEMEYSQYLANVFNAPLSFEKDNPINVVLYNELSETEYMKKSQRTKYTKQLTDDILFFYEQIGIPYTASLSQIQRLFDGKRFDFSVVCQIGFYLDIDYKRLIYPTVTDDDIEKENEIHYMRNKEAVDWVELDETTAPELEKLACKIYNGTINANGRPERVSERLIYRELDLPKHRLENLPKCLAVFEKYSESYESNWARRIIWAYEKLKAETDGKPLYWSDIRHLSGVKKERLQTVIPLLSLFTDETTVTEILKIII